MDDRKIITIDPGNRNGKPCIRGTRITVDDVFGWLAARITREDIRRDFPEITDDDIAAAVAFSAEHPLPGFGAWKHRPDLPDSADAARDLRHRVSRRTKRS